MSHAICLDPYDFIIGKNIQVVINYLKCNWFGTVNPIVNENDISNQQSEVELQD